MSTVQERVNEYVTQTARVMMCVDEVLGLVAEVAVRVHLDFDDRATKTLKGLRVDLARAFGVGEGLFNELRQAVDRIDGHDARVKRLEDEVVLLMRQVKGIQEDIVS